MWQYNQVTGALFEALLMAFFGTFGAAIVELPLTFLVARRLFDFFRGVDALIRTIILSRAFGPGPLIGSLAILITDTGSLGKMFWEALENVDDKQIEGIRSTVAKSAQRYRFGVIPQVTPVLVSRVLHFFESNTRSAAIIGVITGGGIGLMPTQAIITHKDWFSGKLRTRLIKGGEGGRGSRLGNSEIGD